MSQNHWMAQFQVNGQLFTLSFKQNEFNLTLKRDVKKMNFARTKGMNAWLAFADEPVQDDVNMGINAFEVMRLTREHIVNFVHKYQPLYFCFHASTERKAKIYPRFAGALQQHLPRYNLNSLGGSFYFYRQDEILEPRT